MQIIGEISPADGRALAGNNDILLIPVAIAGQPLQFLMNTRRFPTDKLAVRQALLYGTNRTVIIDSVFQGFSPIAWGPLAANTLYYSNQVRGQYAHDTGQAQSLLASAGFEDSDRDGLFDDNGLPVEVNIIVPSWGLIPEVARFLKDQWRTIGIRAVLEPVPGISALIEKVMTGNYNLVAYNIFALDPAFLSEFFSTGGNSNWTGYSSGELDNLLREAARQIDPVVRANLYAQVQRIIMDEALTLPIRDYVNLNGTRITISGLSFDPFGWYPLLSNVSILD